jgi:hypothetical protein
MQAIARDYGFTGTVQAFERELAEPARHALREPDEMVPMPRTCWRACSRRCRGSSRRLPRMKGGRAADSADREASTASNYSVGTADGSRQAWFNMNTYQPRDQVRYTPVEALVPPRDVPGHTCRWGWRASSRTCRSSSGPSSARRFRRRGGSTPRALVRRSGVVYAILRRGSAVWPSERFPCRAAGRGYGLQAMGCRVKRAPRVLRRASRRASRWRR